MEVLQSEMTQEIWDEWSALIRDQECAVCGSQLVIRTVPERASMAVGCSKDPKHAGIARFREEREYNIPTRREFMEQEHGKETALALRRFDAVVTLNRQSATDILRIMWPNAEKASPAEFAKALGLCVDYGLDPRLNELFLIPFKKRDKGGNVIGVTYETVRGIKATRKVALRKHKYSYVDFTPRLMTEDEEKRVYKKGVDPDKVRYITKLKDVETAVEAPGYGEWPMYKTVNHNKVLNKPKGVDKGNSMENMAAIHSERAALERLYPADMPSSRIPVVDESFVDADYHVSELYEDEDADEEQPEGGEPHTISSVEVGEQGGEKVGDASPKTRAQARKAETAPAAEETPPDETIEGEGFSIEKTWLKEALNELKWTNDTCKTFLVSQYKVSPEGALEDVIKRLTREQAEDFTRELNGRAARAQPELFQ